MYFDGPAWLDRHRPRAVVPQRLNCRLVSPCRATGFGRSGDKEVSILWTLRGFHYSIQGKAFVALPQALLLPVQGILHPTTPPARTARRIENVVVHTYLHTHPVRRLVSLPVVYFHVFLLPGASCIDWPPPCTQTTHTYIHTQIHTAAPSSLSSCCFAPRPSVKAQSVTGQDHGSFPASAFQSCYLKARLFD